MAKKVDKKAAKKAAKLTRVLTSKSTVRDLFDTLQIRMRPEDVAEMILGLNKDLKPKERAVVRKASKHSMRRLYGGFSSMLRDFRRPDDTMKGPFKVAHEVCGKIAALKDRDFKNPDKMEETIEELCDLIHKTPGKSSYKHDRMNRAERQEAFGKVKISRRRYNKLFRLFARMEKKLEKSRYNIQRLRFTQVGKSGLATDIPFNLFSNNTDAACFIAYFVARSNLRSTFTNQSQIRPYDDICEMLMKRCKTSKKRLFWQAIAMVKPDQEVLRRLNDEQKGKLVGIWMELLKDTAFCLRDLWLRDDISLDTMIVHQGNDSSTWNSTATAWNKARANWIALIHNIGMSDLLKEFCPGKVMRLMAADVAAWHRMSGGKLDPNTRVWCKLPRPWEVVIGERVCTQKMVENACGKAGMVANQTGWTQPLPKGKIAQYAPTPELVHGVAVSSPQLALTLRKCGYFSGKHLNIVENHVEIVVDRDDLGFAKGAREAGKEDLVEA